MANFNYTASGGLNLGYFSTSSSPQSKTLEVVGGNQFNYALNKLKNPYIDAPRALQRLRRIKQRSF